MAFKIDLHTTKQAAQGRWREIFPMIDNRLAGAISANGKPCPCPIGTSSNGFRIPLKAALDGHAYCGAETFTNGFSLLMWLNDWSFYQALQAVDAALNGAGSVSLSQKFQQPPPPADFSRRRKRFDEWLHLSVTNPNLSAIRYYIERGLLDAPLLRSGSLRYIDAIPYLYDGSYIKNPDGSTFTTPAILAGMRTESTVAGFCVIRLDEHGNKADNVLRTAIATTSGEASAAIQSKQLLTIIPSIRGASWRLGAVGDVWNVGEGVETMLAVAGALNTESVAASTTAAMLEGLEVPEHVKTLNIYADKDKNGRGEEAANKLLMREKERREVNVIIPKQAIPTDKKGIDWLDCIGELAATL